MNIKLFSWNKEKKLLSARIDMLRLDELPQQITIHNDQTRQSRVFKYCTECTDGWAYENESHGLHLLIENPRLQFHGETSQTVGTTYFDISIPEGEVLIKDELDEAFKSYYGTSNPTPTYKKNKRQHYIVGAYKD